jgi:hypothetical protein
MSQKLTLTVYLECRGLVKSLTRIEAESFGVPYPLVSGWPLRYGDMEITQAMLDRLEQSIGRVSSATARKAACGLLAVRQSGIEYGRLAGEMCLKIEPPSEPNRLDCGFLLQRARSRVQRRTAWYCIALQKKRC